jgi:hypothetical protein
MLDEQRFQNIPVIFTNATYRGDVPRTSWRFSASLFDSETC